MEWNMEKKKTDGTVDVLERKHEGTEWVLVI